ncbi:MAG: ankyrin repeat domain-containing protein [Muribaculaceae bacterium]|nr:ankyrin repeat domain-containing protein [Muribaculaceae bacterium]
MRKNILAFVIAFCLTGCMVNDKSSPIGMSPEIFRNTPGWKSAKAIINDDTVALGKELARNPDLITLKDPYYGFSLLFTSVLNNKIKATEKLLKAGFDPNQISDTIYGEGTTPIMSVAYFDDISPKILELLLMYGGSPNSKRRFSLRLVDFNTYTQDTINRHAITEAAGNDLEKVKLLLNYGADVNPKEGLSPMYMAIALDKMDIALYLLENGADYNEKYDVEDVDSRQSKSRGYTTVADKLRYVIVPLDSREYKFKLKVIGFLKEKGINYYETEIPEHALSLIKQKYPDGWEEYINVY